MTQDERRVERFTKQSDGSWRMTEASDGEIALDCIGCTLSFEGIHNKVSAEPKVRLVMNEPR